MLQLLSNKDIIDIEDCEGLQSYINDPFTIINAVIKDNDGSIIAIGILRIVHEVKLIVNQDKSSFKVAKAIKELTNECVKYCNEKGSNEIYAIITRGGEHYENLLTKLDFIKVNGTPLKLEL